MNTLETFRQRIDAMDNELIRVLGERFAICREIARFKKREVIPMMQSGRVEQVKSRCAQLGVLHGINPDLVTELYRLIIQESCRVEDEIIEGTPDPRAEAA